MSVKSARFTALELLNKMDGKAYSNLILNSALKESGLSERDKGFVSKLFYGVVERKLTLEYIISLYSSKPLHKLDKSVVNVLKMGVYQLIYMDNVPDSAAVNESVTLAKQCGKSSAAGFVNAVLRSFIRDGKRVSFPDDVLKRMSIEYSCSEGLVRQLCTDYSVEAVQHLLENSVTEHKMYLRVNSLKISSEKLIDEFEKLGVRAEKCLHAENCISAENLGSLESSVLFKSGLFHVQDLPSQLCCMALNPEAGETVIDICSAPGGKAFTFAEMMNNSGRILACDLHEKRVNLIKNGAERLGITSIEALCNDAKIFNESFPQADKVLCDVPCSGFGVIRSKPELKYTEIEAIKGLPKIQYDILETAAKYLKCSGELVYSTCTLNRAENDDIIDRFLAENKNFVPVEINGYNDYKMTIFPKDFDCEGFFISKIRKVGN
ncbi:MAG: 16S rRNA (cytosine(967)-C(5))-methyltransferase RsmB [Oscillospiraceae bacterium]|nr:16S rRNA (cytosine(967)-C(5))-methyltransferase RsmB [Oscillospiraceae bacterium]